MSGTFIAPGKWLDVDRAYAMARKLQLELQIRAVTREGHHLNQLACDLADMLNPNTQEDDQ